MALDTRDDLASVIAIGLPFRVLPSPKATLTQNDWQHVALCYAGILAGALLAVTKDSSIPVAYTGSISSFALVPFSWASAIDGTGQDHVPVEWSGPSAVFIPGNTKGWCRPASGIVFYRDTTSGIVFYRDTASGIVFYRDVMSPTC